MLTWTKAVILFTGLATLVFGLLLALKPQRAWEASASTPAKEDGSGSAGPSIRLTTVFGVFAILVALVALGRFAWAYIEASPAGRIQLLIGARAFGFLFAAMIAGMLASVLVAGAKAEREAIRFQQLAVPLACSVLVFGSFWAGLTDRTAGPMELLAAFESGFCWELLLNRFTQAAATPSKAPVTVGRGVARRG